MAVTIYDIARMTNTSDGTVSRALNDHPRISDKTKQKIRDAARSLGYRPLQAGRILKSGKTNTIGVILPNFENPYLIEVLKYIKIDCASHGYQVVPVDFGEDSKQERLCLEQMLERRCDGIICYLSRFDPLKELIREFWDSRLPCVVVGLPTDIGDLNVDGIREDFYPGFEKAVGHLVSLGHRQIVHISCTSADRSVKHPECPEFENGLRKYRLPIKPENVLNYHTRDILEDGFQFASEFLRRCPQMTAVIGTNDLFTAGFLRGLVVQKIRVPEDISLVGVDNSWISRMWPVSLTSIDQKIREQANVATKILFERLEKQEWETPKHVTIETDMVVRESTGPVRTNEFLKK